MSSRAPSWVLAALAAVLLWLLASLWFQGGSFLHIESQLFLQHYPAERAFLPTILDVRRNDWEWYQARELSYAIDWLDAHAILASARAGFAHFYPFSHYAIVIAISGLHLRVARRWYPQLPPLVLVLVVALFLSSSHSFFASFFRSAKDLAALGVYALAGALAFFGSGVRGEERLAWPRALGLIALATVTTLVDRQGFFFVAAAAATAALLFALERRPRQIALLGVFAAALAVSELNNRILTPALIERVNGYEITFVQQRLGFVGTGLASLADGSGLGLLFESGVAVIDVVGGFFGSVGTLGGALALAGLGIVFGGAAPAVGAAQGWLAVVQRRRYGVVFAAVLLGMWALSWVMSLKQDYMLQPENRILYYWAPLNVLILLAATVAAERFLAKRPGASRPLAGMLALLVLGNVLAVPRHWSGIIYEGSSWIGPSSAGRVLACLRGGDVDETASGRSEYQQATCRFLLRRIDPGFAGPPRDAAADHALGIRYAKGERVPRDPVESLAWLRRAAAVGHAPAMGALGSLHFDEITAPGFRAGLPSAEERTLWLEKGAHGGDAEAQYALAAAYHGGQGVPRDRVRAFAWALASAKQGHRRAGELVRQLREILSDDERRAARRLKLERSGTPR